MSVKRDEVEGDLIIRKIPKDLCWGKPEEFVRKLLEILGVSLQTNPGNEFTIVGHQTPTGQDKGKLWIRLSRSGIFQGFFLFQGKKWTRIHNYRSDEVVWMQGDSRNIPEGFQLIEPGIGLIQSDVVDHIVGQYFIDTGASTPTQTVYQYFAVRYIGTT